MSDLVVGLKMSYAGIRLWISNTIFGSWFGDWLLMYETNMVFGL